MFSSRFRHPHTQQERRESQDFPVRAKRRWKYLSTAWDDIKVHAERSWKKHRRTQYKNTVSSSSPV